MELKLSFNPTERDRGGQTAADAEDAARFQELWSQQGIGLKLWALWKKNHITSQYFLPACIELDGLITESIEEFQDAIIGALYSAHPNDFYGSHSHWLVENWDHFNPNIRRGITFVWEEPGMGFEIREVRHVLH